MSRITELFKRKNNRVLNVYCTAGFPRLDSTIEVMKALQDNGADLIELGMPYSDPLADGPVIQASSTKALENGMTIARLFEQLAAMRENIQLPVLLMGYMNPVLQYGFEKFCEAAAKAGVDGLILPDLPIYEFETEYGPVMKRYGLDFVFLVTPETSEARVRQVDALSSGFLYAVSSSSTTGKNKDLGEQEAYFARLKQMRLGNPVLVGFGIRDRATFEAASKYANGAIIGTAYIRALEEAENIGTATKKFLSGILGSGEPIAETGKRGPR
ncbi:tryptophan synthase subunit alpha [Puia sp.]|jgi:tryptophan synthase alpha chain|uniref:tryptophan synthase subunit alpha n=1 Tax=Puia sp. TaxID=2045100 RepID=UPI002F3F255C